LFGAHGRFAQRIASTDVQQQDPQQLIDGSKATQTLDRSQQHCLLLPTSREQAQ
jgi:hypothetical protein